MELESKVQYPDVDSLLVALRNPPFTQIRPKQYIYRGQANAEWRLIPSAFRDGAEFATDDGFATVKEVLERRKAHADAEELREDLEIETLRQFFDAADEAGLSLPEDTQAIRYYLGNLEATGEAWPPRGLRSILALAQHHGLPTRLLDWTRDWRVACFCAARDRLIQSLEPPPSEIAVWSLDIGSLLWHAWQLGIDPEAPTPERRERDYSIEIVTAPNATNANLRAQKGLFTLLVPRAHSSVKPDSPLEGLLEGGLGGIPLLHKMVLPALEAPSLLKALAFDGVTSATLFPDYGGVVSALKDRSLWASSVTPGATPAAR
jgi:hypothetical protein